MQTSKHFDFRSELQVVFMCGWFVDGLFRYLIVSMCEIHGQIRIKSCNDDLNGALRLHCVCEFTNCDIQFVLVTFQPEYFGMVAPECSLGFSYVLVCIS